MTVVISHNADSFAIPEASHKRKESSFEEPSSKRSAMDQSGSATTIQRAYRAHKHKAAIQPENYEVVCGSNFPNEQWEKFKVIASDLQRSGHFVFAHGAKFPEHTLFVDIRSYLASEDPAFHSSWNTQRALRSQKIPLRFHNTQEYLQSETCKKINTEAEDDGYPNNRDILSVDGYLDNREELESAYDFYSKNTNVFEPNANYIQDFLEEYLQSNSAKEYIHWAINRCFNTLKEGAHPSHPFTQGQGRLYLIAIAKEMLENPEKSYVWRSHAYGKVCTCNGEHTLDRFTGLLEQDQKGEVTLCKTKSNPQYRILTANLQKDPTAITLALDSITPSQKETYQKFMWPIAHLIKNFHALESLSETSSYEDIVTTLLRIRFDPPSILCSQRSLYTTGLKTILEQTLFILAQHYRQLAQDPNLTNFFAELSTLSLSCDFENIATLYHKYPSHFAKIQENGLNLKDAPEELKNNYLFVLRAISHDLDVILYAGVEVQRFIINNHSYPENWLCTGAKYGDADFIKLVLSADSCKRECSLNPNLLIRSIKIALDHDHKEIAQSITDMATTILNGDSYESLAQFVNKAFSQGLFSLIEKVIETIPINYLARLFYNGLASNNHTLAELIMNSPRLKEIDSDTLSYVVKHDDISEKFCLVRGLDTAITKGHQNLVTLIIEAIPDEDFYKVLDRTILLNRPKVFHAILNSPRFKTLDFHLIYQILYNADRSNLVDIVRTLMQSCSNGTNPILSFSKEDILHQAIELKDTSLVKTLVRTGVFSYQAVAYASVQIATKTVTGTITDIFRRTWSK